MEKINHKLKACHLCEYFSEVLLEASFVLTVLSASWVLLKARPIGLTTVLGTGFVILLSTRTGLDERNFALSNCVDSVCSARGKMEFTSNDLADWGFWRHKTITNVHVNGTFRLFLNVNLCVKSFRSSRECTFLRKLFHNGWSGNVEAAGLIFQNIIISKLTLPLCVPSISTELALTESWLSFSSEQRWSIAASNNLISALQTMLSNLAWSVSTVWSLAWILLILVPDGVLDARVVL